MKEVSYVLDFERAGGDGDPVACGPVTVTVTTLDASGKPAQTERVHLADTASYSSTYTLFADGIRFTEGGTMSFGENGAAGTMSFSPAGCGYLVPPADEKTGLTPGIATWSVNGGSGFFAGAAGTITSRFGVDLNDNRLVDQHLALILLPEEDAA